MESNTNYAGRSSLILNIAAFFIIIAGLKYASTFVGLFLLALFITIICAKPMAWLASRKVPHGLSIAIVLMSANVIIITIGQIVGSSIGKFTKSAPLYTEKLNAVTIEVIQLLNSIGMEITTEQLKTTFDMGKVMTTTAGMLGNFGGVMGNVFIIMFVVLFLLMELNAFAVKTIAIVGAPNKSLNYFFKIGPSIRHYLWIKTLISLATGVFIYIGLKIIGVEYAVLWALIAFFLNFIPNLGSFIAMIPAILFAMVQLNIAAAFWTLVVFVSVNLIMGSLVEPRAMGKEMGLSTLVVFISLIFWGFVLGTIGMFLSVPLTMAVKIMLEQNDKTKWVSILLGTTHEAQVAIERRKYKSE